MFKKTLIITTLVSSMFATNIDDVVSKAYEKNLTLKTLEKSLDVAKQEIDLATKWKNPTLSFGATDLQFGDLSRRDKEAMQAHFIGFSQVFPIGDKLDTQKEIALNDFEISKLEVEDRKLQFKALIYEYIYNIELINQRLALFEEFKTNVKKLEQLLEKLYEYNKASQVQVINSQIMYKELNLKTQTLQTKLNTTTLKLEQIVYEKIDNLDIDTKLQKLTLSKDISSHPKLQILDETIKKFENLSLLEKQKKFSDVNVNVAYFQRDDKFNDYMNISVAIPLSIYGSEDIKAVKARFKTIELNQKLDDMKKIFENNIDTLQQKMDDSLTTYKIVQEDILPKYKQLQNVLEEYNSTNSYKNVDAKALINNLNEIIKYKLKAIDEKQDYFEALSKSKYFIKDNK
jgi:outer membrane protein TolC